MDLLSLLPLDFAVRWLGELFQTEMAKMALLFLLAGEIHKRAVKKEFALLRQSIDHVADVMGKRIDGIESRIIRLEREEEK